MLKRRVESLDVLKGLSIILVVIGHLNTTPYIHNFIYSVHLFSFVFVSGFFYKKRTTILEFIKKDLIKTWALFMFFSIVWIGFDYLYDFALYMARRGIIPDNIGDYLLNSVIALVYGNANLTGVSFGAIWYLAMLLALKTLYYSFDKAINRKTSTLTLICVGIFCVGVSFLNGYSNTPYYIASAMSALLIFHLGRLVTGKIEKLEKIDTSKLILATSIFIIIYSVFCSFSGDVNLGTNKFETPWTVFPNIILGISSLLCLSVLMSRLKAIKKVFAYCGRNSLSIMGWHSEIRICMLFLLELLGIHNNMIRNVIVVLFTLILCIPLNKVTDKLIMVINNQVK